MPRRVAVVFLVILFAGLVAPYFFWENYLSIFRYNSGLKGDALSALGAAALAVPFAAVLWYVEERRAFDLEDLIGWGLVPVALFLAFQMNSARHLVMVLLVPDKRGLRNVAVALGLALHAALPSLVPLNSALPLITLVLIAGLSWHLRAIGWRRFTRFGSGQADPGSRTGPPLGRSPRNQQYHSPCFSAAVPRACSPSMAAVLAGSAPSGRTGVLAGRSEGRMERIADSSSATASRARCATARERGHQAARSLGGRVLWDYGDQQFVSYLASVRKSILAMMFGPHVASGKIRLDQTLAALRIDDIQGLLPEEKKATVADLLAARSGVYHPAANAACTGCGSTMGDPPGPRGSIPHGTYFLYNNWDFNALGTIFEQATGQNIYDAFEQDFARPMQFQDFDRAQQRKTDNPRASSHPAYHFNLSTRDMARVGYLMLREGDWNGRQIISREWARRITTVVTPVADMNPSQRNGPFGCSTVVVWNGPWDQGPYRGAYTGVGAIGQFITVLPALDMVVAHKTRQGQASVGRQEYLSLVDTVIAARCGPLSGARHDP
jgi:CubicO group peptidase (beta-lactamase class C family)